MINFDAYEVDTDKIPYYDNLPGNLERHRSKLKKKWKIEQRRLRLLFKKDLVNEIGLQKYRHKNALWNLAIWSSDPVSEDHYDYKYIYQFYKRFKKLQQDSGTPKAPENSHFKGTKNDLSD